VGGGGFGFASFAREKRRMLIVQACPKLTFVRPRGLTIEGQKTCAGHGRLT